MRKITIALFIFVLCFACWPEDELMDPIMEIVPQELKSAQIETSIYTHQSYYSLAQNTVVAIHEFSTWELGFESDPEGHHIVLNSAQIISAANLGAVPFETNTLPNPELYTYDASSGNYDSLAINNWYDTINNSYTGNLYLIADKLGPDYVPFIKLKFIDVNDTSYTFLYGDPDAAIADTFVVKKNLDFGFTKVSLRDSVKTVNIDPAKENWDVVFTQYQTILFTSDGIATPYAVRGVLLNPGQLQVATYTISQDDANAESEIQQVFLNIPSTLADTLTFSNNWDAIGYNWKNVTIDEASNTATYTTNTRKVFMIKDNSGNLYKLHFTSFYNDLGVKGYPEFEYIKFNL